MGEGKETAMWWQDLLLGFWNGLTAWVVLIVHVFGGWEGFPLYDFARHGNWYDFGFLVGAGSPLLGALGSGRRRTVVAESRAREGAESAISG
jgi:hypothetical protein